MTSRQKANAEKVRREIKSYLMTPEGFRVWFRMEKCEKEALVLRVKNGTSPIQIAKEMDDAATTGLGMHLINPIRED